uniref:Zinc finger-containing ubiquitin peptidase 1 n=1 Tax=Strigamia maritima TaxID=126957 RepID=T1JK96_STRMM
MAEKPPETIHCCEICGQEGLRDEEMRTHMLLIHIEGATSCPFCDLSDISVDEMIVHVNSVHLDYLTPDEEYKPVCTDYKPQITIDGACASPSRYNANYNHNFNANSLLDSPQRSQLSLNLKSWKNPCSASINDGGRQGQRARIQTPTPNDGITTHCPICGHCERSPTKLQEHVNRQHFDLTSPSFPDISPLDGESYFNCPLCMRHFESSPDLELHVNMEHKDILSPAQSAQVSKADCVLAQEIEKKEKDARKLREQREFEMLRAQYGMDNHGNFREQSLTNMQRAVYAGEMSVADYYNRQVELKVAEMNGVDDGHSCSLVPKIRAVSLSSNNITRTWMCTTVDHYGSTYGDKGWGCGYRNIQMLLSSLMHHTGYNEKLFNGKNTMPSISKLQELIEAAWRKGFDPQGCEQLGGKLFNTRKWIGATEVVTFLNSFRVRGQLVDFHRPTTDDGTHPELFHWILEYFQKQDDFKPPIYLQHQGHSRTVVGCEQLKDNSIRLLIFDPSHNKIQMEQFSNTAIASNAMRLIRRPLAAMKARQYQIVAVNGIIETEQEYQQSKLLRSILIPEDC